MATNLTLEAPHFDRIRQEAGQHTADAIHLLWLAYNVEARERRTGVRAAVERWAKAVVTASPTTPQHNYHPQNAAILRFDGNTPITLTGIRHGREGALHLLVVLGTGSVTLMHNSSNSDERNRFLLRNAEPLTVTTNRAVLLAYLNTRWRDIHWI